MEYAEKGDLQKRIDQAIKAKHLIPEKEIWKMLSDVTNGTYKY
jgi:hypothetical protein